MSSRYGLIGCLIVVLALLESATAATQYTVGDGFGWAVPPNNSTNFYDDWVSNKTFQIGDSIIFNWTGEHTATEVPKEYYDNCTKLGIILTTPGVMVTFNENGTHYYLCSISTHCEQGQKVKIVIGDGISDTGSASSLVAGALSLLLSTLVFQFLALLCLN
ncbi:hypothetical protein Dsin_015657 [Dipteronia sinensis]|uniref:Phytocyanin domain-containing protein n=1 Tax=Dipteronia sinensis TaxID=43782 RepID=A0AAE0E4S1_9ROSI|nr:hypothetical protein Dsin_015657 [Dipteronia sinensis]